MLTKRQLLATAAAGLVSSSAKAAFHMHGSAGVALGGMTLVDNVLVVYNTNSSDSIAVKNYYLANRPGMTNVSTLGITCATTEIILTANLISDIRAPIVSWLQGSPKTILYIIMCRGIPSRQDTGTVNNPGVDLMISNAFSDLGIRTGSTYFSAGIFTSTNLYNTTYDPVTYAGTTALVTRMDMGSLAATQAYIDKLKTVGNAMASPNVLISAANASLGGTNYYLDGAFNGGNSNIDADHTNLVNVGVPGGRIIYVGNAGPHISSGVDVTGYETIGTNAGMSSTYPTDGSVVFSGKSGWWVIKTIESYNGQQGSSQGNFEKFFNPSAWGGTNASNGPVGAVVHVEEPGSTGVESTAYLANWEAGRIFAETAWGSRVSSYFMAVGDPLVKR